jgi:hypothetical protein
VEAIQERKKGRGKEKKEKKEEREKRGKEGRSVFVLIRLFKLS